MPPVGRTRSQAAATDCDKAVWSVAHRIFTNGEEGDQDGVLTTYEKHSPVGFNYRWPSGALCLTATCGGATPQAGLAPFASAGGQLKSLVGR